MKHRVPVPALVWGNGMARPSTWRSHLSLLGVRHCVRGGVSERDLRGATGASNHGELILFWNGSYALCCIGVCLDVEKLLIIPN